jgi:hypothetical protein
MNTDYDIELVERYFENELTETEAVEFQERVNSDDSFRSLVNQEKILIQGIRLEGLSKDLRFLKSLENNIDKKVIPLVSPVSKVWYYAAAAVATLAVAAAGLLIFMPKESPQELFARYYDKPYPNVLDAKTRGGENDGSKRAEAFDAYEAKDYARAAELFTELLKEKEEPNMLMLLGNSNLMLGRVEEAKQNFITLINNFDELDIPAKWFLSLCYLKTNDLDNARKVLKELSDLEVFYAGKAKKLLNETTLSTK